MQAFSDVTGVKNRLMALLVPVDFYSGGQTGNPARQSFTG